MPSQQSTTPASNSVAQPWFQFACGSVSLNAASSQGGGAESAVLTSAANMWDNGITLTYGFLSSSPGTSVQQNKVKVVITEWEQYANVHFQYVSNATDVAQANIRITFDTSSGSWSYVAKQMGQIPSSEATMNLGWLTTSSTITQDDRGVILHEFGHSLGLLHEHQSPARGGTITLKDSAVIAYYTYTQKGWTVDDVYEQILDVYNLSDVSNFSALDLKSVMMYFMPADMNEQGIEVDVNDQLSETDIAFMMINYPFTTGVSPSDSSWTLTRALQVAGVDTQDTQAILSANQKGDWKSVRSTFTLFCAEARAADVKATTATSAQDDAAPNGAEPPHGISTGPLGPDGEFRPQWCDTIFPDATSAAAASPGIFRNEGNLWIPGSTITYTFLDADLPQGDTMPLPTLNILSPATDYRKGRVRNAFATFGARVNLQFLEKLPTDSTSSIRISFGQNAGFTSWSRAGPEAVNYSQTEAERQRQGGLAQTTLFFHDWMVWKSAPPLQFHKNQESNNLYHEIGHVLGLGHEVAPPLSAFVWNSATATYSVQAPFDSQSIMLYSGLYYGTDLWNLLQPVLTWTSRTCIVAPSAKDLALLGVLYPKSSTDESQASNKFLDNLVTLGFAVNSPETTTLLAQRDGAFAQINDPTAFDTAIMALYASISSSLVTYTSTHPQSLANLAPPISTSSGSGDPSRGVNPGTGASTDSPTTGPFLDVLLSTLTDLFSPTTGQIFALQFPGRFLNQAQYAWDTTSAGIYGQFVKPTVVNESEFRLVDQLYNVGTVVGAPNGINLSIVYEQCLNNLLPGFQSSILAKQQDQIRQWLLKDVTVSGWVSDLITAQHSGAAASSPVGASTAGAPTGAASGVTGSPSAIQGPQFSVSNKLVGNTVNRMELADALMQEYLSAKQAWELERDNMIQSATPATLANVTRNLSHITAIREAQLASKYADAVVRGYSHVIRQYMGYMDIKTSAESLQDAKDALRESSSSSLDGSLTVYPVQMQPIDWFQGLSTSFTSKDLTSDPALIDQQIDAKSKQLDVLNSRLASLQLNPKIDTIALQAQLDDAQAKYDDAQVALTNKYTNEVISLAKSCISAAGVFLFPEFEAVAEAYDLAQAVYDGIDGDMQSFTDAQQAVTTASRAVSQLLAQKALASATDTQNEQTQITLDINSLTKDLNELTARRQALRTPATQTTDASGAAVPTPPSTPASINDVNLLPPNVQSAGGSRWQDVIMHHTVSSQFSTSSTSSQGSTSQTNIGLFLYNSSSSSSSSSGTSSNQSGESSYDVQIGFRATLVTVDRSGWFQPQFFKQSSGFYHIDDATTWSKWPAGITTLDDLKHAGAPAFDAINKYLLPAYPVGFIICKDITIKIAMTASQVASDASNMQKTLAKSQGVLCFSTSSAESSTSSQNSYTFTSTADGIIIRIPGPQILGYYLQLTDNDQTQPMPTTLPDGFLISDADYDSTVTAPSNATQPTSSAVASTSR